MKTGKTILGAITVACMLLTGRGMADEKSQASAPAAGGQGQGMSMMDMTGQSKGYCIAASDSMTNLMQTVREAIKSNDKAKMKTALLATEQRFGEMQSHMAQCSQMMDRMNNMMGPSGRGMMGTGSGQGMMGGGSMGGSGMMAPENKPATPSEKVPEKKTEKK